MAEPGVPDPSILDRLGEEVAAAARRAETGDGPAHRRSSRSRAIGRRLPPRVLLLAALLVLAAAAVSAAATLLALRGAVIPAPSDTPVEQTPAPGSASLAGLSAADPQPGRPPWTVRLARSRTGLLCSTVGQMVDGRFGIVGLDGRFRQLSPEAADACSIVRSDAASLVGARVFDAPRPADVRTVVSGIGGDRLRSVTVETSGVVRPVRVGAGGTFVAAYAGLPEDLAIEVRLAFADGHVESHPFGVSPLVLPDPSGGAAWRLESGLASGDPRLCISVAGARERPDGPQSPSACGRLGNAGQTHGVFFAIRRLTPGGAGATFSPFGAGAWRDTPPRLLVWGAAGRDVVSIDVRGPDGARRTGTFFRPNGSFAYMFGPRVLPGQVVVTVHFRDGRELVRRTSTGVVPPPTLGGLHP